ncbi:ATS16 metalloproteinase, partial [Polypterus senegalus]
MADASIHLKLHGFGQDFHLELQSSKNLLAPGFMIQMLGKNGTTHVETYKEDDLCFYQGSLRSKMNSSVALSTCNGMWQLAPFIRHPEVLQVLDETFLAALLGVAEELPIRAQQLLLQHPLVTLADPIRAAPNSNSHEALWESEASLQPRGAAM